MNLDRDIRSAVNVRAHAEGQIHANAVKRALLAQLEAMRTDGASYAELMAYIATWPPTDPMPTVGVGITLAI